MEGTEADCEDTSAGELHFLLNSITNPTGQWQKAGQDEPK